MSSTTADGVKMMATVSAEQKQSLMNIFRYPAGYLNDRLMRCKMSLEDISKSVEEIRMIQVEMDAIAVASEYRATECGKQRDTLADEINKTIRTIIGAERRYERTHPTTPYVRTPEEATRIKELVDTFDSIMKAEEEGGWRMLVERGVVRDELNHA